MAEQLVTLRKRRAPASGPRHTSVVRPAFFVGTTSRPFAGAANPPPRPGISATLGPPGAEGEMSRTTSSGPSVCARARGPGGSCCDDRTEGRSRLALFDAPGSSEHEIAVREIGRRGRICPGLARGLGGKGDDGEESSLPVEQALGEGARPRKGPGPRAQPRRRDAGCLSSPVGLRPPKYGHDARDLDRVSALSSSVLAECDG
jgi:hypothetical protein